MYIYEANAKKKLIKTSKLKKYTFIKDFLSVYVKHCCCILYLKC